MADLHLLFDRRLAKRAAEGFVIEQRIVPETPGTSRTIKDASFDRAPESADELRVFDERDHADKPGRAISGTSQPIKQ